MPLTTKLESGTVQTVYEDEILDNDDVERVVRILRAEFHLNGTIHVQISRETAKGKQLRHGGG